MVIIVFVIAQTNIVEWLGLIASILTILSTLKVLASKK